MNIAAFLEHWQVIENPFRGEEARHDPVFARLAAASHTHPDFEKILGDLSRPASAIVFGEKGSGKTAIRLQIADRIRAHNEAHPESKVLLIAYDDLNPMLDRFCVHMGLISAGDDADGKSGHGAGGLDGRDVLRTLSKLRLVDHIDAILHVAVAWLVDAVLGRDAPAATAAGEAAKVLRRADGQTKLDLLLLQALYDRPGVGIERTVSLRRALRAPINWKRWLWMALAVLGWTPAASLAFHAHSMRHPLDGSTWVSYALLGAIALWVILLLKQFGWEPLRVGHLARRLKKQLRTVPRTAKSIADSLARIEPSLRDAAALPTNDLDDRRYAMLGRLMRIARLLGYGGAVVVIDRVDEPTLLAGSPERMRAVVWPLMNNKFLQQDSIGVKMLLPIELRHELFRESSAFFQEARLDKQNFVERLSWSGSMLYDLCNARLNACRKEGAGNISLLELFEQDVTRQDIIDALDHMHQPRDAFKLIYQCIAEHCAAVTADADAWRIPKHVLEHVKKQQVERVQMFYRGVRPA